MAETLEESIDADEACAVDSAGAVEPDLLDQRAVSLFNARFDNLARPRSIRLERCDEFIAMFSSKRLVCRLLEAFDAMLTGLGWPP